MQSFYFSIAANQSSRWRICHFIAPSIMTKDTWKGVGYGSTG
jgi:hypothetical protein